LKFNLVEVHDSSAKNDESDVLARKIGVPYSWKLLNFIQDKFGITNLGIWCL